MDYNEEGKKVALELMDKMIVSITPDDVIAKTDELVKLAANKEMTGAEKFEWVVAQVEPMLWTALDFVAKRLVQLMYEIWIGKVEDFRNGTN